MTIKHYACMAVPILFFFAFCCEGWGLNRAKRAQRAGAQKSTQNADGTTQPQLPPR